MSKYKSLFVPGLYGLILLALFTLFGNPSVSETAEISDTGAAPDNQAVTAGIFRGASTAVQFDESPPLTEMILQTAGQPVNASQPIDRDSGLEMPLPTSPQDIDPIVQSSIGPGVIPGPLVTFDAMSNLAGVTSPDPVGDVGPNHYLAMSNLYTGIYDKVGNQLIAPFPNNSYWAGFGGDCETDNSGDPIVLYDQFADRWIVTQFTASGPTYFNCLAITTSPDPLGSYYRYAFSTGSNFPDYPKYGIWSDALFISTREFSGGITFAGVGAYAIKRADLIAGNPAAQTISFLVPPGGTPYNIGDGLLPADIDGSTLPPAGAPGYFVGTMDDGGQYGAPSDALNVWEYHADFVTPANSSFTLAHVVPVAPFDSQFPCSPTSRNCIPQPGTSNKLDILSYRQRPLFRLAYRNFGTHESLVTNQAVEASTNLAGIRWYELRDPDNTATLFQQGTYAPGMSDGIHRWMGSIAMDQSGNMALGYSASNGTSTFPSVWYTGRLAGDPLGTMPQGEGSIMNGTGTQTGSNRWGDYTAMNIDPVDDCTFWYVNEYVPVSSSVGWRLRVGSFKFADNTSPPNLLAPVDAALDLSTTPFFSWSDVGTSSYLLEIATDAGFGNIIYNAPVATASHQAQTILNPGSHYFWRVTANNPCGTNAVSAVNDFTTRQLEYCSAPGTFIDTGTITDDIVISDTALLSQVSVELNLTHSWIGDLVISLQHLASATTVSLIDQPGNPLYGGFGCNDNNLLNFLLVDGSSNGPHDNACNNTENSPAFPPASDWDPIGALSAFEGENVNGTWRLSVTDMADEDTGSLARWCIVPDVAPEAVGESYNTNAGVTLNVAAPGVLANDSDPNGDPLTAVLDTDVSDGTLTLNADGSFTYIPDPGFYGQDTFTYHANDGTADSNTVTVTIDVIQDEFLIYMPAIQKP